MAITNQDLEKIRRCGRNAALGFNRGEYILAGEYLALNDHERSLMRSEFEEGVRNSGASQNRVNVVMGEFKYWCEYWESTER